MSQMVADQRQPGGVVASIIVPAFNAERTLGQCLDALFSQTIPRDSYEVILVDDGSVDGTRRIAADYPICYLYQENQGPAAARNHGAGVAKGEVLLFTDSDCVPAPDWAFEMLSAFDDQDVAAVKGAYRSDQAEMVARFAQVEFEQRFELLAKAETIDMVDTYSAGYRKEIFHEMEGFDTGFPQANNEDTDLSYRMASKGLKMVFNPRAIVAHLGHPDTVLRYARLKFSRGFWRMVVYKRFPDKMLKDSYTPWTLKLQILMLLVIVLSLPIALLMPAYGVALMISAIAVFIALSLPFIAAAFRQDVALGLASPALLVVRAAALGLGAAWGALFGRLAEG